MDITIAGTGLVALSPVLGFLAAATTVALGWPPIFAQKRAGRGGRVFMLYKFRTMTNGRGPDGALLPDAERLRTFGRFLRATSLDELPELWNVVRGDMSLVGPRPFLAKYLDYYTAEQMRRHDMRPGITGWAAVNGRNALTWEERFALDVWYVTHWSLGLDFRILARTAQVVARREGISGDGDATMPEFKGSRRLTD